MGPAVAPFLQGVGRQLAHEGRNALTGIQGALDLVARRPSDAEESELLREASQRAAALGGRLDALARVLQGGLEPCRELLPLDSVLPGLACAGAHVLANRAQLVEALATIERCLSAVAQQVSLEPSRCVLRIQGAPGSGSDLTRLTDLLLVGPRGELVAGLPLAKGMIEAQGGSLELSATSDQALEAKVLLPLALANKGAGRRRCSG